MADFILLMHDDTIDAVPDSLWPAYFARLRATGAFEGGSSIGGGEVARKSGAPGRIASHLTGFIRVTAPDLAAARELVAGNPVFECGGTVELRELPRD